MPIIEVRGLSKTYRVFQKEPGLRGGILTQPVPPPLQGRPRRRQQA